MESLLRNFQTDLGAIGAEIKHLQDESLSMSSRLQNRKVIEEKLSVHIKEMALTPALIHAIFEGEVNDAYLTHLATLTKKIEFVSMQPALAARQLRPELEKLRLKAVARIREFLLAKFSSLRKPRTNIQILQQNTLLRFSYLNLFIAEHAPDVANEVRQIYIASMSRIYSSSFRQYVTALMKHHADVSSKSDLLGVEESVGRKLFASRPKERNLQAFRLLTRGDVLFKQQDAPAHVPHTMPADLSLSFEQVYRSTSRLLLDAASAEYAFDADFFPEPNALFKDIFAPTLALFTETVRDWLFSTSDAIGILIVIRLVQADQDLMARRRVSVLESHMNGLVMLLWPKFKTIMDMNLRSLRETTPRTTTDIKDVLVRYAEFVTTVLRLDTGRDSGVIESSLMQLRAEVERLISRFSLEHKSELEQVIFTISKLDTMLLTMEKLMPTKEEVAKLAVSADAPLFRDLMAKNVGIYVELVLEEHFSSLVAMVKAAEPLIGDIEAVRARFEPSYVGERVVKAFADSWQSVLHSMTTDVKQHFDEHAKHVLQPVLSQLALYYKRFVLILNRCYAKESWMVDVVSDQALWYGLKKAM